MSKNNLKGFLYYAHNTSDLNYLKITICSALTGKHYIPDFNATVVTDKNSLSHLNNKEKNILNNLFNNVIIKDVPPSNNKRILYNGTECLGKMIWLNGTRPNAYIDSPYQETILLDGDFIFQNDLLYNLWGSQTPLKMYKDVLPAYNFSMIQQKTNDHSHKNVGKFTIPMYWATVTYFNRDNFSKTFFELLTHIRDGYTYYQKYFQMYDQTYRNDYAFSIALHIMNGYRIPSKEWEIPFPMVLIDPRDYVYRIDKGQTKFLINTLKPNPTYNFVNIQELSYHCMNKFSLYEKYDQFMEVYYNE